MFSTLMELIWAHASSGVASAPIKKDASVVRLGHVASCSHNMPQNLNAGNWKVQWIAIPAMILAQTLRMEPSILISQPYRALKTKPQSIKSKALSLNPNSGRRRRARRRRSRRRRTLPSSATWLLSESNLTGPIS